jgi:hypothetical protein
MTFKQKMGLAAAVSAALGFSVAASASSYVWNGPTGWEGGSDHYGNVATLEELSDAPASDSHNLPFEILHELEIATTDVVTLTFSGIALTNASAPVVNCQGTYLVAGVTNTPGTYEYVNNSGSNIPAGCCLVTGVTTTNAKLKAAGLGAKLTNNFKQTALAGIVIDTAKGGESYPLAAVVKQFHAEVEAGSNINGVIQLESGSVNFTTPRTSTLTVNSQDYCVSAGVDYVGDCVVGVSGGENPFLNTVVSGNFSFLDNGATGCNDAAAASDATVFTNHNDQLDFTGDNASIKAGCGAVGLGSLSMGDSEYLEVYSCGDSATCLPLVPGAFTEQTSVTWSPDANIYKSEPLSAGPAGVWTTDGFTAFIPYMPYDAEGTLSRVVYITNATKKSGSVTLTVGAEGESCTDKNVATATAGGVTQLSGAIDAAVNSCFPTLPANGKVWVSVSAEFPSQNGSQMYSAYVQNGLRYIVINTSNNNTL